VPTPQQIRAELDADPAGLGYAALPAGADGLRAARLNDPTTGRTRVGTMRVGDFANWLAGRGLLRTVNEARTHSNEYVGSAALLLMFKIQGDPGRVVDPADAGIQGMFGAFVAAGVVAADDATAFTSECTAACSRAEELWGAGVSPDDVAAAYGRPR